MATLPKPAVARSMCASTTTSLSRFCLISRQWAARCEVANSHLAPSRRRNLSTIPTCPAPTCPCAEMPRGLDINYERPLSKTVANYTEHILIPTGRSDWKSRIDDDESLPFVRNIKDLMGNNKKYWNPYHNVLVSASSFPEDPQAGQQAALVLSSFQYITPKASSFSPSADIAEALVKGFILPKELDSRVADLLGNQGGSDKLNILRRDTSQNSALFNVSSVRDVIVLICGHTARDDRCGIMGPLLEREFEEKLAAPSSRFRFKQPAASVVASTAEAADVGSIVGQISHIGGHAFAGNVIVYVPHALEAEGHALAGKGIWYGRVEPRHVEGIVKETIEHGRVIQDLFRGAVGSTMSGTMAML